MGPLKSSLFEPIEKEITMVEDSIKAVADVDYAWFAELLSYIVTSSGKRIRPAIALLAGKLHDNCDIDMLIPVATSVELVHTATLVHDDTIDLSLKRRGKPTAASIWSWGIATMAGDYLFASAAESISHANNVRADRLLANTLMALCTGELEESFSSFDLNQTRQEYYKRIGNKTASLFAMATEAASIVCSAPEEAIQSLRHYGYSLGMAFQIIDDILDITATEDELGKPVASDLRQGTLTLPSIMLRERRPDDNPIKDIFENRQREQNLQIAIDMIRNSEIVPECFEVARGFIREACQSLEAFPDSQFRKALLDVAVYVVERQE